MADGGQRGGKKARRVVPQGFRRDRGGSGREGKQPLQAPPAQLAPAPADAAWAPGQQWAPAHPPPSIPADGSRPAARKAGLDRVPQWAWSGATMVVLTFAAWLTLEVIYPAIRGDSASAPRGIIFNGLVEGSLYALTATALILIYRITRIINFAQVAIGSAAGYFLTQMAVGYELPTLAMIPVALIVAFFAGVLAELAMRRFAKSPRLFVTVATITLAPAATLVMSRIVSSLNPLPASAQAAARIQHLTVPIPFSGWNFRVDPLVFNFAHAFTLGASAVALICLAMFLMLTRSGRAIRAAADNAEGAALLGINTRLISTAVWGIAAFVSGVASIGSLLLNGIDLAGKDGGTSALLPALAACMVAGFESIPLAVFFALWLYVMQQGTQWAFPNATFVEPALLVIVLLALLLRRKTLQRRQRTEAGLWESIRSLRPPPRALRALPTVQRMRASVLVVAAAVAIIFPFIVNAGQIHAGGTVLVYVMIAVSLLIVTSWLGQINLGQFALVAVGAIVAGGIVNRFGLSFWAALPIAMIAGAAVAVLLGLAALRIQGLWLAPVTLVLAAALPVILFSEPWFSWLVPQGSIDRPGLPLIDLNDEKTFYFFLLVCAVAVSYVALRFRYSSMGRLIIAIRDNESAALASGIDPLYPRVIGLALAGVIAGFAGALLAVYEQSVDAQSFGVDLSLNIFVMLVLGGMGGVSGAVLGAVFGGTMLYLKPEFAPLITGVGALMMLLVLPGGLSQAFFALRDAVLRLIAIRRGIDVPSLMGTTDTEGERRWRLAPPERNEGLAALPADQRWAKPSFLWGKVRA